jgi:hypothetical protein
MKTFLSLLLTLLAFVSRGQVVVQSPVISGGSFNGTSIVTNPSPYTVFTGNTGNGTVVANVTNYLCLENTYTNLNTADVSGGTRTVVPRTVVLTNLYVIASTQQGSGKTISFAILTNGVPCSLAVNITNGTVGSDTTHSDTVLAGSQIGLRIISTNGLTAAKYAWGLEAR